MAVGFQFSAASYEFFSLHNEEIENFVEIKLNYHSTAE